MSKTEIIVAAQCAVSNNNLRIITSTGIRTATRANVGEYVLELKDEHHTDKWIPNATLLGGIAGQISVIPLNKEHVQINAFDATGTPADSSFAIQILRLDD
jgi:hypothetical protein